MSVEVPIRCVCGNVLAVRRGAVLDIRHKGRHVLAPLVVSIVCEDCHATWRPEGATDATVVR